MALPINGLYVIIDPDACGGVSPVDVCRQALEGGASVIQWRDKRRDKGDQFAEVNAIAALCASHGAAFIVNDHIDSALASNADGVHLGQHDLPIERARAIAGDKLIIGVSTNNAEEARRAESLGADYIAVGAIFSTGTKSNTRPADLDRLREVKASVSVPVVAIGGINETNIAQVVDAGADAAAVISAVCGAADPRAAAARLAHAFGERPPTATTRKGMHVVVDSYLRAINTRDRTGLLSLFAIDGLMEDPASHPPHIGKEAIGNWWDEMRMGERPFEIRVRNIAVAREEAALSWTIAHEHDGGQQALASGVEIISVEPSGLIASIHSYWSRTGAAAESPERAIAQRFTDALNARDRDAFLALWSADGMRQDPVGEPIIGINGIAAAFDLMLSMYPNYQMSLDDICVSPGEAALVWSTVERQEAGSRTVRGVDVLSLDDRGQIAALHSYWEPDNLPPFE
jgi:thiamine-phosphate diphosphorylase